MNQPVPDLSEADLARVVQRDFADSSHAMGILESDGDGLSLRAKIAAVKVSGGSVETLRGSLQQAHADERDVIAWAEYPRFMAGSPGGNGPQRAQTIAADRDEYRSWLDPEATHR